MKFDPKKLRYSKEGSGRCVSLSTEQKPEGILRRQSSFAEGRVAQIIFCLLIERLAVCFV